MRTKRLLAEILERLEQPLIEIGATLERMDGTLERMDGTLERMDGRLERMDGRLERMDGRLERMDGSLERLEQDSMDTRSAIENNTQVTREILLEAKGQTPILRHIDEGVQSNARGLMHVLDELRNGQGGPGPAAAA